MIIHPIRTVTNQSTTVRCSQVLWKHFKHGEMTLKVKICEPRIQYLSRESRDAYLMQICLAQIHCKLLRGQDNFPSVLSQNWQNDLEGQHQWPLFSIPAESIPGCTFGINFVIPVETAADELSCGQDEFPRSQKGQMTLKVNVNNSEFQYLLRVSQDTCLVQIRDSRRTSSENLFSAAMRPGTPHPCYFLVFCLLHVMPVEK